MNALAVEPLAPVPMTIARRRVEIADTFTLELATPAPFAFEPGQFNMLYAFGIGEAAISISGDPHAKGGLVHTIRAVGAVTNALRALRPGDALGVRGPFGRGWPIERAVSADVVLIAGGIGLAPLRPVIYALLADRARFGRVTLLYGARTPRDILFRAELARWRGAFDIDVQVTVDHASSSWRGDVGVVTALVGATRFEPGATVAMVCGPEVMMRYALQELLSRNVPAAQIFLAVERNMKCGVGFCGHCQLGPKLVCKEGPVFAADDIGPLLMVREI